MSSKKKNSHAILLLVSQTFTNHKPAFCISCWNFFTTSEIFLKLYLFFLTPGIFSFSWIFFDPNQDLEVNASMYGTYIVSLAGLVLPRIFFCDSDLFLGAQIFPLSLGLFFHHWRFPLSSVLSLSLLSLFMFSSLFFRLC